MIAAYPLTWPPMFARAKNREVGRFKSSLSASLKNVLDSLRLFGADSGRKLGEIVISSNVTLGVARPADPGVAVWFTWDGLQVCIAVDRYSTVEGNLQAIHHILEARRVELRHGTLALVRASFSGFTALPAPAGERTWREVMEFVDQATPTGAQLKDRYRRMASIRHPDSGGTHESMVELNKAYEAAQREIGSPA
jgi:hypothetical protein